VSLAKMVVDLLGAAEADAARETARDAQLARLLHAVEDQGAMLLELAESVRALTAKLETPPGLRAGDALAPGAAGRRARCAVRARRQARDQRRAAANPSA
jgi:hypothetical protein